MNQQEVDSIMSQIEELNDDETKEIYRQLRKKRKALHEQKNEEKVREEQEKNELL